MGANESHLENEIDLAKYLLTNAQNEKSDYYIKYRYLSKSLETLESCISKKSSPRDVVWAAMTLKNTVEAEFKKINTIVAEEEKKKEQLTKEIAEQESVLVKLKTEVEKVFEEKTVFMIVKLKNDKEEMQKQLQLERVEFKKQLDMIEGKIQGMLIQKMEEDAFLKEMEEARQKSLRDVDRYVKTKYGTSTSAPGEEESKKKYCELLAEIRTLKEQQTDTQCQICFENRTNAFIPCGHTCMCMACAVGVPGKFCPICREKYAEPVELFFS